MPSDHSRPASIDVLPTSPRAGFALVLVLGFLVLITVLVVAFFSSVTTDLASTKQYSAEASTKQLADSVVQLAMGQIKTATTGANLAWASQPGMIRTFDTSGNPAVSYKLYSSDAMTTSGPLTLTQIKEYDSAWNSKSAVWTDLNAPVIDASGTANFPIVDGNNIKSLSRNASGDTVPSYLGYDAVNNSDGSVGADGLPDVDGFAIDPSIPFDPAKALSLSNTPVPMPVKWLYRLSDGTLLAPDAGGTTTATFNSSAVKPSANNPIVGRVAFWTDDETSKINVNTAAEGTYWDTPRFQTSSPAANTIINTATNPPTVNTSLAQQYPDYAFSCFQPARFEFQRYPGHPAQVALSTVFPGMTTLKAVGVTPRIAAGGTQGGATYAGNGSSVDLAAAPRKALYASVDEYLYASTYNADATTRQTNQLPATVNRTQLQQAKFFITTGNRAPEVNLYGQPRVACWPVDKTLLAAPNTPRASAYDRLIAYCTTLRHDLDANAYPYYFQRGDSQSPTADYAQIPRNATLYNYLRTLTSAPVPGFGGNFQGKYSQNRDQILTEIFDYIRCTNLDDPSLGGYPITDPAPAGGTWPTTTNQFAVAKKTPTSVTSTSLLGLGQVMPIRIGSTKGFGRFACVKEVAFVLVCTGDGASGAPPIANDPINNITLNGVKLAADECRVQMMVLYRLHSPSAGLTGFYPDLVVEMANLENLRVANATNIGGGGAIFPRPPTGTRWLEKVSNTNTRTYNVPLYFDALVQPNWRSAVNSAVSTYNTNPYYPFISQPFTVRRAEGVQFSVLPSVEDASANLIVRIYQGKNAYDHANSQLNAKYKQAGAPDITDIVADSTNNLFQTAKLRFPSATFVAPTFLATDTSGNPTYRIEDRLPKGSVGSNGSGLVLSGDTIGSMYYSGDQRLAALLDTIPTSKFAAYPNFGNPSAGSGYSTANFAQHQLSMTTSGYTRYRVGGTSSSTFASEYVPPNIVAPLGDYDMINGTDLGALINKPDEGDTDLSVNNAGFPPYYYYDQSTANVSLYTPNRVMPSPGMFGSLPTGSDWQTLLFRPQPTHPGAASPPDHLWMDLFWMPIVEPYAISEPFSTAGKVNMNYQIAPFTYFTRSAALKGAMKIEMGCAIANAYKNGFPKDTGNGTNAWRKTLNLSDTDGSLRQFQEKFASGDLFRSASQICDVYLVPKNQSWSSNTDASTFWSNNVNTPENVRERPYANLYARLTTKSNTFTVHMRAQSLQKVPGTNAASWVEGRDQITGEYRGSSIVERYVDPDDATLPDFATATTNIDAFYKFRVVSARKFAP